MSDGAPRTCNAHPWIALDALIVAVLCVAVGCGETSEDAPPTGAQCAQQSARACASSGCSRWLQDVRRWEQTEDGACVERSRAGLCVATLDGSNLNSNGITHMFRERDDGVVENITINIDPGKLDGWSYCVAHRPIDDVCPCISD